MVQVPKRIVEQAPTYGAPELLSCGNLFRHEWAESFTFRRQRFAWLRLENVVLAVRQQPVSDARVPPAHDEDDQKNGRHRDDNGHNAHLYVCQTLFKNV